MLIVCPACASEYRIDAEKVGAAGRSVRCAACRETWFIGPDDVAAGVLAEMNAEADPFNAALDSQAPEPGAPATPAAAIEEPAPRRGARLRKPRASPSGPVRAASRPRSPRASPPPPCCRWPCSAARPWCGRCRRPPRSMPESASP